jgi:hypothetical protein
MYDGEMGELMSKGKQIMDIYVITKCECTLYQSTKPKQFYQCTLAYVEYTVRDLMNLQEDQDEWMHMLRYRCHNQRYVNIT